MKSTLLLGLLASTSFASARILPGTHVLAVGASLISGPWPALAKPVWRYTSVRLNPRQANSTTSATAGTYTVVSGDTLSTIAAAEGVSTQQLEDANPGVVPTDLQVGQVLNLPSSASSTPAAASSAATATISSSTDVTSTSEIASTAAATSTGDTSDLGSGVSSGNSVTDAEAAQKNTTSSCGGHHHHHHNSTGTTGSAAKGQNNGTELAGHHVHNSTSFAAGSGQCNGTSHHHHHHNGTSTATATGEASQAAASFFIPVTATASALAVPLTSSVATSDIEARAVGGFVAMVRRP
jgi:LysM domain